MGRGALLALLLVAGGALVAVVLSRGGERGPVTSAVPVEPSAARPASEPGGSSRDEGLEPPASRVAAEVPATPARTTAAPVPPAWTTARQFLWGQVAGPRGPLVGAEVRLVDAAGVLLGHATSGEEGRFQVPLAEPTDGATLRVAQAGYAPFESGPHRVGRDEKRRVGIVRLRLAARLSGRVVDEEGRGVGGAEVALRATAGAAPQQVRAATDGRFVLPGAPLGSVRLEASAPGFGRASRSLDHAAKGPEVTLVLRSARSLEVLVLDTEDAPVPGAEVHARGLEPPRALHSRASDAGGRARFDELAGERWELTVLAEGFEEARVPQVLADGSRTTVRLERLPCLAGTVEPVPGRELPDDVVVRAYPADPDGTFRSDPDAPAARAGADGTFELCALPPGTYVLEATAPGAAPSLSAPLHTGTPAARAARVPLRPGGLLHVTVGGPEGRALAGAVAELYARPPSTSVRWWSDSARHPAPESLAVRATGPEGLVTFEGLAGDRSYWVCVRSPGLQAGLEGPVRLGSARNAVAPETRASLSLRAGATLSGTVLRGGEPVPGVRLTVTGGSPAVSVELLTDALGSFATAPLPPGTYRVRPRPPGPRDADPPATSIELDRDRTVELELERSGD